MNGIDWMDSLAGAPSTPDVIATVRQIFGAGASKYLAQTLGVTMRTAQRYLTGQHQPKRAVVTAKLGPVQDIARRRIVADRLRGITAIDPGQIKVVSKSQPRGPRNADKKRNPGVLDRMGPAMHRVADAWEKGNRYAADALLGDAVIARYAKESATNRSGLAANLLITDYSGISYI